MTSTLSPRPALIRCIARLCFLAPVLASFGASIPAARAQVPPAEATAIDSSGPVRLRQPQAAPSSESRGPDGVERARPAVAPYVLGEFELFVQRMAGTEIRRLGADLVTGALDGRSGELSPAIPADYLIGTGDEVLLTVWGSVDADLRLVVDRAGRISVPRVGAIQLGGVRYGDLESVIEQRVGKVFKNFQLHATLGQLRSLRVFVTGFVVNPGAYNVGALSTVLSVLMRAGGPSAAGSFRSIELKRGGAVVGRFDLYDLLLRGDRSADRLLQAGDVVHASAIGPQAAVIGSVNRPVIVELAPGEGITAALWMAGGLSSVADRKRLAIERLEDRMSRRVVELALPEDGALQLDRGDVLRAFSAAEAMLSTERQNKRVRVDGEVQRPGEYVLAPESTLRDAIAAAGGVTGAAFLYGAQFSRDSVRATQQENYERALRDLETDFARASSTQRLSSGDLAVQSQAQAAATNRLVERLRALKPSGRVVLQLEPLARELPALVLEDGDRLYIPPRPSTVGVFGSVFNTGSYLYGDGRTLQDYLRLAGGPTRGADEESSFVVRANGQVISGRQHGGGLFASGAESVGRLQAQPGDTVFVPELMDKTTFVQAAKDWTQILYQFGIGIAGIVSATR